jgi:hypothetical protein
MESYQADQQRIAHQQPIDGKKGLDIPENHHAAACLFFITAPNRLFGGELANSMQIPKTML